MCDSINSAVESQRADGVAMGTIYSITCQINGKPYVGQTRRLLEVRLREYNRDSKKAKSGVDAAIRKYGWDNFTVEVLEVCPVEMLNECEIYWIAKLNSKVPHGYNLTDGGKAGWSHTLETRAEISAKLKGRHFSDEHRANISKSLTGENHPLYGKHHSNEARAKNSASNRGRKHSPEELAKMRGKKRSLESCANISAGKKGKKGKSPSDETRAKMSVSQKARREREKAIENGGES